MTASLLPGDLVSMCYFTGGADLDIAVHKFVDGAVTSAGVSSKEVFVILGELAEEEARRVMYTGNYSDDVGDPAICRGPYYWCLNRDGVFAIPSIALERVRS